MIDWQVRAPDPANTDNCAFTRQINVTDCKTGFPSTNSAV